ncbi:thiamine-phosphate kinase [Brachybacterium saurashtrense]|uniref:Thiamine-monophosphate kinase n=1 Tax=Brachybacterium saurashtrense TaxID=556288 RepID=A0A345YN28_9MICO|nr:thiamine-phosphate kinase [Brachybacterium saurashtrense]AXK45330.1 thiamine-phosphate kinase [Brachybacterium saurashtrense]RRR21913.1 thiamine-phosphate kinase [Brachybacterium saurashtrense]
MAGDPPHPEPARPSDLRGEAALLGRMLPHLRHGAEVEVGPGDDAAVVRLSSPRLVVTTDTLVEGHDFLPRATTARWIGRKAAVQNLADVAAMGARPTALVAAISAPAGTPAAVFEELTIGMTARAEADGASIVGGDLGRADRLTLTVTAMGALEEGQEPVLRSGGRPGDVLAIGTPRLGRSAAGLALVLGGRALVRTAAGTAPTVVLREIRDPSAAELVQWHDAPEPDLSLGWTGGRAAHAMMDLSDGLVRDGGRLARASQLVVDLDRDALAPDVGALADLAAELDADPWDWVLHGGEEHAMLAAFAPGEVPAGFRPVGRLRAAGADAPAVLLEGRAVAGEGFDHFA